MFERFTQRARIAVVLAQQEARTLRHDAVDTEHLLVALLREGDGVAADALVGSGVTLDRARDRVLWHAGPGERDAPKHVPFADGAKRAIEAAVREARRAGERWVGTEHLLLGLVTERRGLANRVLEECGAPPDVVRSAVLRELAAARPGRRRFLRRR